MSVALKLMLLQLHNPTFQRGPSKVAGDWYEAAFLGDWARTLWLSLSCSTDSASPRVTSLGLSLSLRSSLAGSDEWRPRVLAGVISISTPGQACHLGHDTTAGSREIDLGLVQTQRTSPKGVSWLKSKVKAGKDPQAPIIIGGRSGARHCLLFHVTDILSCFLRDGNAPLPQ